MIPRKEVQEEHILVPSWREFEINMSHKSSLDRDTNSANLPELMKKNEQNRWHHQ